MPPAIAPTFTDELVDVLSAVGVPVGTDDEIVGVTVEMTVEMLALGGVGVGNKTENSLRDVSHSHVMGLASRILLRRRYSIPASQLSSPTYINCQREIDTKKAV